MAEAHVVAFSECMTREILALDHGLGSDLIEVT